MCLIGGAEKGPYFAYPHDALKLLPTQRLYDFPAGDWRLAQNAEGYHYTLVNGTITLQGNECTGETSGILLRHGIG